MKLVWKIFKNLFSSKSKIKGGTEAIGGKMDFFSFFAFFWNFSKKISNFLKKYEKNSTTYTGHMEPKIILFAIFPQTKMVFLRGKIAKNQLHLAKFGCVSGAISIFRKPGL